MQNFKAYILIFLLIPFSIFAEDGSKLWLRFPDAKNGISADKIISKGNNPTLEIARKELMNHWKGQALELRTDKSLKHLKDGYTIKSIQNRLVISAEKEIGLLYGVYHLLRLQETKSSTSNLNITEKPSYDVRILNHWETYLYVDFGKWENTSCRLVANARKRIHCNIGDVGSSSDF